MTNIFSTLTFELSAVSSTSNIEINLPLGPYPDNYDKVRSRNPFTNKNTSRNSSMSSTISSVVYHERMANNNSVDDDVDMNNNSPALFYEDKQEKVLRVSKAAEHLTNTRLQGNSLNVSIPIPQCVLNEEQWLNPQCGPTTHNEDNNIINIQLPYNPHAPTEPELWDGSFHPISLHGSIEHLALDAKNIKDSLNFIAKYISNKQINPSKANEVREFNSIGEAIWNLISLVYNVNCVTTLS